VAAPIHATTPQASSAAAGASWQAAGMANPTLRTRTPLTDTQLNELFTAAWPNHVTTAFAAVHRHSLTWISAWRGEHLIGYVNVATDGGHHTFLLDTTVHPAEQRHGLGRQLVHAAAHAAQAEATWLHVDYEPHLDNFYQRCGFTPTTAGLLRLR
jgi:GNAT superfamily N-acetyltransferase